jgi:hypothetical protein
MKETLWVFGIVALSSAVTAAGVLPALEIVRTGEGIMLACASIGIPLEIFYFLLLGVALRAGPEPVPGGWFWRPFAHHHLLTPAWYRAVIPVFAGGALAFLGIVLGVAVVVLGMLAGLRSGA